MLASSLTASRLWLAAGWFIIHYLWIGALAWAVIAVARRGLRRSRPETAYPLAVAGLGLLLAAAGVALWLAFQSAASSTALPVRWLPPAISGGIWSKVLSALPWFWLVGAGGILGGTALGVCGAHRLRRECRIETSGPLADCCRRLSRSLLLSQQVAVGVCDRIGLPILIGVARPLILLPAAAVSGWSPVQVEMILLHELLHVRRRDNLVLLCQRGVEAVLFFHPAVWWVSRWIEQEREFCCDDLVLSWTGSPCEYVETLVTLAEQYRRARHPAVAASFGRPPVVTRVRRILFSEEEPMQASRLAFGMLVGGVALTGLFLAGLTTGPAQAEGPAATQPSLPSDAQLPVLAPVSAPESVPAPAAGPARPAPFIFPPEYTNRRGFADFELLVPAGRVRSVSGMRSWGPEQVEGEPNTPEAGDQVTAWASRTPDEQEEWLICEYAEAINPASIVVHETYNPGAVFKITTFDAADNETIAWEGEDPTPRDEAKGISIFPVKLDAPTKKIKVYIDSVSVPGWNEIDAVGLRTADGTTAWAKHVTCSTTYAEPNAVGTGTRSYGPEQAQGEPNVPSPGDSPNAWASLTQDGQAEWLVCEYENAVVPTAVAIHETYAPGAVNKVSVFKDDGTEMVVWEGEDPTPRDEPMGISVIPIDIDFPTRKIKVYIDSPSVPGWNEIDAVGLRDSDGQTQWAMTVEASSTYADVSVSSSIDFVYVPQQQLMQLQAQVEQLQQQVQELQQLRDELKEIKALLQK